VVKALKVLSAQKKLARTCFAVFTAFFPRVLKKCQFLDALSSVDGTKNLSRFIMVQSILPQPNDTAEHSCL
jgi:hypothetical protein